jgi:hypothetical protein
MGTWHPWAPAASRPSGLFGEGETAVGDVSSAAGTLRRIMVFGLMSIAFATDIASFVRGFSLDEAAVYFDGCFSC